jgi:hypothetical protein
MHSDLNNPTGSSSDELESSGRLNDLSSTPSSQHELPPRLNKREEISEDYGDREFLFLSEPEYDEAIIGVAHRIGQEDVIAYDYNKVCEVVAKMMGNDDIMEVMEYVEFNVMGAYVGERTPIFVDVV